MATKEHQLKRKKNKTEKKINYKYINAKLNCA